MKFFIRIGVFTFCFFLFLSGCSILFGEEKNAFIAYGSEKQIQKVIEKNKLKTKEHQIYKFKLSTIDKKQVLILNETTAK
ncbi:lipoprotein BA_5634 family protein, partial [Bacillus wiedmannii]|uniref:lipoprotein BA_5634 family protein n=1 Tax=Bacillus wiedmannii TaxID=1890302 RepID=UPI000BEB840C